MLERNNATTPPGSATDALNGPEAAIAAMTAPLTEDDPCGPDLDLDGDSDYLNYFANAEGVLPTSFFGDDGRPFDRSSVDLPAQVEALKPLLARTRDLRLLVMRARLMVLDRNLPGFALSLAAIAECLDRFWDTAHPRPQDGDLAMRQGALTVLEVPTVTFPLQYIPLFEVPRVGTISYRSWMIANGEVKERPGDIKLTVAGIVEARSDVDPEVLAAVRRHLVLAKASLARIRNAFMINGASAGLENLPTLVEKILSFVDPAGLRAASASEATTAVANAPADAAATDAAATAGGAAKSAGVAPASLADARQALAAIAEYYSRSEPSSPTLLLVRQAHQLVGKSFIEVINLLVPAQIEKAMFQIGSEQYFELPVGKLSQLLSAAATTGGTDNQTESGEPAGGPEQRHYHVETRSQAIVLLEQISRYFRYSEPSSPVPMLCERARVLAERDFMSLLRDVLPKSALKTLGG